MSKSLTGIVSPCEDFIWRSFLMQNMLSALSNALSFVQCSHLNVDLFLANYQKHLRNWNERHAQVRMLISSDFSHRVLSKLTTCWTAAEMWQKLCSLYFKRTAKNVFTLPGNFYDHRLPLLELSHTTCIFVRWLCCYRILHLTWSCPKLSTASVLPVTTTS